MDNTSRGSAGTLREGTLGLSLYCSYEDIAEIAVAAERRGFEALWVSEAGESAIIRASAAIHASSRIEVGTNVALAFPRSPTAMAMDAWDLSGLSGGRFSLGLGSQVRRIIEDRYSSSFSSPAARMAEYLQVLRSAWAMERGDSSTFTGQHYRLLLPSVAGLGSSDRKDPQVYVAAVGPLMTKTAVRYADGILGHPFTSDRFLRDTFVPRIESLLEQEGRPSAGFRFCQGFIVSADDDGDRARRAAKLQIAFYGTTPNYAGVFASYGDEDLCGRLRGVWKSADGSDLCRALVDAVPDEALDRYAIAGEPAEVRTRVDRVRPLCDQLIVSPPWFAAGPKEMRERTLKLIEALGPDRQIS